MHMVRLDIPILVYELWSSVEKVRRGEVPKTEHGSHAQSYSIYSLAILWVGGSIAMAINSLSSYSHQCRCCVDIMRKEG